MASAQSNLLRHHVSLLTLHALKCFFIGTLSFWVIDILSNLSLVQRILSQHASVVSVQNFLGLLISEMQIACCLAVVSLLAAGILAVLLKNVDFFNESVVLFTTGLCGITILAGLYSLWGFAFTGFYIPVLIAGVLAPGIWLVLHAGLKKRSGNRWTFSELMSFFLYPALVLSFSGRAIAQIFQSNWDAVALNGILAIIFTGAGFRLFRSPSSRGGSALRWFPASAALALVIVSLINTSQFGKNREQTIENYPDKRPHVILIVLDTVRADHLKRRGYHRNTMPFLEKWADSALITPRAFSPAGWTSPAHASIFSGRTVSMHGVHYSSIENTLTTIPVDGIEWLPERLSLQGYYCLAVTANHLALPADNIGFHRVVSPRSIDFATCTVGGLADSYSPLMERISERMRWRMPYADAEQMVAIVKRAVPRGEGPLFLFVNFMDAHSPYNPPASSLKALDIPGRHVFSRYLRHRDLTAQWNALPAGKMEYLHDLYDGELRWLDMHLEKLVSWLDRRFGENAVIIITSDHGEELGEEGRVGHEYGLSDILIRVPIFIRGPGIKAGRIENDVTLRSLFHFILRCSSGDSPDPGILAETDAFGILSERYPLAFDVDMLGTEYGRPWVSVIEGVFKGVGPSDFGFSVYRVDDTGFEDQDQILESSEVQNLRKKIDDYWENFRDRREKILTSRVPSDDEIKRLRSLGYLQ